MTDSEVRNADMVEIRHPGHPGVTARITRRAFENRSRKLGWVILDDSTQISSTFSKPVVPDSEDEREIRQHMASSRKEELRALLDGKGVEWDGRWGEKRLEAEYAKVADA